MEVLSAIAGFLISLPIAVIVFQKHMRSFDSVWGLPAKEREAAIADLRAKTPAIGQLLALFAIAFAIVVALVLDGLKGNW